MINVSKSPSGSPLKKKSVLCELYIVQYVDMLTAGMDYTNQDMTTKYDAYQLNMGTQMEKKKIIIIKKSTVLLMRGTLRITE